ncbi:MAG: hypothetical protein M1839_009456 [Geoglossum umbratile]|nr:MAG: hypothetical protein M1839_009456 [Geoglossum umbratile]
MTILQKPALPPKSSVVDYIATMISDELYQAIHSPATITSLLAENPTEPPGKIAEQLYGGEERPKPPPTLQKNVGKGDLDRANKCGKWGRERPSDLFLMVYHDVLSALEDDPLAGMVSPPLMGSCGVLPLTVISTVPDIARHMANCIARATSEVYFATNFWAYGDNTTLITNALRELSRRAGERGQKQKIVVKVIYDRGNIKQFFDNHQIVPPSSYTTGAVQLPSPDEIPNIDMEVINFHRPLLGTFHSKYVVIDRKIALLTSCNIMEIDNLEMMCHFEGPIVDSFYDMALISWHKALTPPLPTLDRQAAAGEWGGIGEAQPRFYQESIEAPIQGLTKNPTSPGSYVTPPSSPSATASPFCVLPEHTAQDPHYDPDIASEAARVQAQVLPLEGKSRVIETNRHLNAASHSTTQPTAPECLPGEEMTPYVLHPQHEPFPIAMSPNLTFYAQTVPNNASICTPQNLAWLSGILHAQRSIFIQSPTMNAEPLIPALMDAVKRGVDVRCYLTQGYNDGGELLPMQGGTNEMVVHKMYTSLELAQRKNLHVYYYVAKDQARPINAKFKQRASHIKLLIIDSILSIQGNGNQDTQSWFHSQEINVMVDSALICSQWEEAIRRNQNTERYGEVSVEDGVWRDEKGEEVEGAMGWDVGRFAWAKGFVGAVQRVRGIGGF